MRAEIPIKMAVMADEQALAVHRRRSLMFLMLAVGAVGFTMTLQLALNSNFVGQEMRLTGLQQGLLETCRESCGIFALGILALLAGMAESLIAAAMLLLLAVGMTSYAFVPTYGWLVLASMVWSQGLHVWMPLPNSMGLALADKGKAGRKLGQLSAAGAVGSALGLSVALVLVSFHLVKIRPLWILGGLTAIVASAACLAIPRNIKATRSRLVIRKKYRLYYLLCFLEGWRKQIFIAFAGYLLVVKHGTSLQTMLILWIINQAIAWMISPIVGRGIDRFGERRMLLVYYLVMTSIFVGYATITSHPHVLYGLFVADGVFFVFAMALTTYVNRIAPPEEHTSTLSMGVAMNHVAAVTMPLVGGLLWRYVDYRWAFIVGAVVAAISALVAINVRGLSRSER